MEKYRILCVDDDIMMLNSLEDMLMMAGYEVSLSKSGAQALKILEKGIHCDSDSFGCRNAGYGWLRDTCEDSGNKRL